MVESPWCWSPKAARKAQEIRRTVNASAVAVCRRTEVSSPDLGGPSKRELPVALLPTEPD